LLQEYTKTHLRPHVGQKNFPGASPRTPITREREGEIGEGRKGDGEGKEKEGVKEKGRGEEGERNGNG
jgi:hypothetical protein